MNPLLPTDTRVEPGLSRAAAGHLAHEFRASLHAILGYAVLIESDAVDTDTLESAVRIREAATHLGELCEDVVDALRPPSLVPESGPAPVDLDLAGLVRSLERVAVERGLRVHIVNSGVPDAGNAGATREEIEAHPPNPAIYALHRRVVTHLLEHVVRYSTGDVTIACAQRSSGDCVIVASPMPDGFIASDDGIAAIATRLLVGSGGALRSSGRRLELMLPIVG